MRKRKLGPHAGRVKYRTGHLSVMFGREKKFESWRVLGLWWKDDLVTVHCHTPKLVELDMAMRRIDATRIRKRESHLSSKDGRKEFPQLWSFLAEASVQGEKGEEDREPGSIWIGVRNGSLHCVLKEASQGLVLRVEVKSLTALLTTLEAALGAEGSMWELDTYPGKKRPGKRS